MILVTARVMRKAGIDLALGLHAAGNPENLRERRA
jgi:hypothetical protein